MKFLKSILAACLLVAGMSAVCQAQEAAKALLLVAAPELGGPFRQTALVAVPAGGRYFGFILNRATDLKLSTLFPSQPAAAKVNDPVYFGGPEMNDALFAVVTGDPGEQALSLFGNLFITNRAKVIDRIIEQTPNDARYFAGLVAWLPGELESEIAIGVWHVAEPDAGLVFRRDTSRMWEELVKRLGIRNPVPLGPGLLETRLGGGPA